MDWLIEADHPIQRIADYDEWVSVFETAMRGLPEKQRQVSVLTVLDACRHPAEVIAGSAIPSERFRADVRAVGFSIPRLSALLIGKYIADLGQLQVLWCCV